MGARGEERMSSGAETCGACGAEAQPTPRRCTSGRAQLRVMRKRTWHLRSCERRWREHVASEGTTLTHTKASAARISVTYFSALTPAAPRLICVVGSESQRLNSRITESSQQRGERLPPSYRSQTQRCGHNVAFLLTSGGAGPMG